MPLPSEINYWNNQAGQCVDGGRLIKDNVWKRMPQLQRLLRYDWFKQHVLEIGHGNAVIAGALRLVSESSFSYTGTELGAGFREFAQTNFQLNSVEADVRELPGTGYTRIIAFDSLEHVRPEHRLEGYRKMAEVAAPGALLFIHYSNSPSYHDKEFDHPFGLEDLVDLETAGFALDNFEAYQCLCDKTLVNYVFVVMRRKS